MKIEKEILYLYFNGDATPEEEHKIRQYLEAKSLIVADIDFCYEVLLTAAKIDNYNYITKLKYK